MDRSRRPEHAPPVLLRWRDLLSGAAADVIEVLTDRSEDAAWLRSASPFADDDELVIIGSQSALCSMRRLAITPTALRHALADVETLRVRLAETAVTDDKRARIAACIAVDASG